MRPALTADRDDLAARLADIPLVDQHCHSLLRGWRTVGPGSPGWRRCFTEAVRPTSIERDVPAMRGYREFLQAIGGWLGLDPAASDAAAADAEARVAATRDARATADRYAADLLDDARVELLLVDTGYGGPEALDPGALEQVAGRPVRTIARVESLAEQVLADSQRSLTPARLRDAVEDQIEARIQAGAVGLKTVAAYRCGLDLREPTSARVRQGLADRSTQARRLDDAALVALTVRAAVSVGRRHRLPLQVHTGFGDEDLDLPAADPSLLRSLLRDPGSDGCPIVLLHGYPFIPQAAYLASIHPDVYVDLSLTIPQLGAVGAEDAISAALALCPTTKLLAGTDGHTYPEMHWRGARLWREALAAVLGVEVGAGRMDVAAAAAAARSILSDNAQGLYRLG